MTPVLLSLIMDMFEEPILATERRLAPESENESRLSRVSELWVEGLMSDGIFLSGGGDVERR